MAIQLRRGQKTDFDGTKLLPGECAICLDTDQMYYKTSNGAVELQNKTTASYDTADFFTPAADIVVSEGNCTVSGKICQILLRLQKSDSSAFSQTRIDVGTVAEGFRPAAKVFTIISAANNINSHITRQAGLILLENGEMKVDCFFSGDAKSIYVEAIYILP